MVNILIISVKRERGVGAVVREAESAAVFTWRTGGCRIERVVEEKFTEMRFMMKLVSGSQIWVGYCQFLVEQSGLRVYLLRIVIWLRLG